MGYSFHVWKFVIILVCIAAFILTLIGGDKIFGVFSSSGSWVSDLTNDRLTLSYRYNNEEGNEFATLKKYVVNGKELLIETVDDEARIAQGLSDRRSMPDDQGLLFVMPNVDKHTFWMYRMNFAIDMIWLRDGVIVEIAPHMPPPAKTGGIPKTYTPEALADMVLELTAGGAERYGLKVGDKLDF